MITVLSKRKHEDFLLRVLPTARLVETAQELNGGECLLSFGSGIIVPEHVLRRYGRAYNFHAGSPNYPGRDPHHWAAYEQASEFGATAHVMTALVDAGSIVGVQLEKMPPQASTSLYQSVGFVALSSLFSELAPLMVKEELPRSGHTWGPNKRSRAHTLAMLDFRGLDAPEVLRRQQAFAGFERHFTLDLAGRAEHNFIPIKPP